MEIKKEQSFTEKASRLFNLPKPGIEKLFLHEMEGGGEVKNVLQSYTQDPRARSQPSNHASRLTLGVDNKLPPLIKAKKKKACVQRPTMFLLTRWSKKKFRKKRHAKLNAKSRATAHSKSTQRMVSRFNADRFHADVGPRSEHVARGKIEVSVVLAEKCDCISCLFDLRTDFLIGGFYSTLCR